MPANLLSRWLDRFLIRVILLFVSVLLYYRLFQNLLISVLLGLLTLICLDLVLRILKREEKKKLTVPDLLAMFSRASGSDEANDKMLLS